MALVNEILQVSSAHFYDTSSIYRVVVKDIKYMMMEDELTSGGGQIYYQSFNISHFKNMNKIFKSQKCILQLLLFELIVVPVLFFNICWLCSGFLFLILVNCGIPLFCQSCCRFVNFIDLFKESDFLFHFSLYFVFNFIVFCSLLLPSLCAGFLLLFFKNIYLY